MCLCTVAREFRSRPLPISSNDGEYPCSATNREMKSYTSCCLRVIAMAPLLANRRRKATGIRQRVVLFHVPRGLGRSISLEVQCCGSVLVVAGVVAGARLNFVALYILDFDLAVAAVELGVVGSVANVVLAAQFIGDLVESVLQLLEVVADIDQAASSLLGKFFHFAFAVVTHAGGAIKPAVGAEQHV